MCVAVGDHGAQYCTTQNTVFVSACSRNEYTCVGLYGVYCVCVRVCVCLSVCLSLVIYMCCVSVSMPLLTSDWMQVVPVLNMS